MWAAGERRDRDSFEYYVRIAATFPVWSPQRWREQRQRATNDRLELKWVKKQKKHKFLSLFAFYFCILSSHFLSFSLVRAGRNAVNKQSWRSASVNRVSRTWKEAESLTHFRVKETVTCSSSKVTAVRLPEIRQIEPGSLELVQSAWLWVTLHSEY